MLYKELNLKKIREACDLDFAHYTYQRGQCSCCYGPKDLPARYWCDGKIPSDNKYSYILFKNANNGSGIVRGIDEIKHHTYIKYRLASRDQLIKVCNMLQEQLGDSYIVVVPENDDKCIIINKKELVSSKKPI